MDNRGTPIRRAAPAKINLGLHVLRRREDGFHDIESVLVPIGWHDTLVFDPAPEPFTFTCSDPSLPTDDRNLCVRAARDLARRHGLGLLGHLHLEKNVPHGAGLGGGSSDAAATLRLLARCWQMAVPKEELHKMAARLGSDAPFFLYDRPLLATGRGDELEELRPDGHYRLPFPLAVIMPRVRISTAEAYQLLRPGPAGRPDLREVVLSDDLQRWRRELINDFDQVLIGRHPEIAAARGLLIDSGAGYAALTGSGAAVFGVFEQEADAVAAVAEASLERNQATWWGYALTTNR